MAKFSGKTAKAPRNMQNRGPLGTFEERVNHEGSRAYAYDDKTALFLMATSSYIVEDKFYEDANEGLARFVALVHRVTRDDPEWVQAFIPWLRDKANIRTASMVAAAEYARAGGPLAAGVVDRACLRADEPGEMIGYLYGTYGRRLPQGVRKGLSRAVQRLYNQYSALKYDTPRHGVRFGDVIELTHPSPKSEADSVLYHHLLGRRRGKPMLPEHVRSLPDLRAAYDLDRLPAEMRRTVLREPGNRPLFRRAGFTWERLAGWLPGGMDAEAWEAIIPQMGYMALLRNLRNFDKAGISKKMREHVIARLADPAAVHESRQFPYRFFSAYSMQITDNYKVALTEALDASVDNVPSLKGSTLVMVDVSGSMNQLLSLGSRVSYSDVAALFGTVTWKRNENARLVAFASDSLDVRPTPGASIMHVLSQFDQIGGAVGYGTEIRRAIQKHYNGEDRIIVLTDGQEFLLDEVRGALPNVPFYGWNLAGYDTSFFDAKEGRYVLGGFTDNAFRLIQILEEQRNANWNDLFRPAGV